MTDTEKRRQELRATVNSLVTDDSDRIDLHRAINAWQTPAKALNLESRLDLAAQWVYSFDVGPAVRSDLPMWTARVVADKVGNAGATFTHDAESPSDALSLALADAAAWTKAQRDIK